jgi:hypothetical protein
VKSFIRLLIPAGAVLALGGLFAGGVAADNSQVASNVASSTQTVAAISGDATADGINSQATSGAASAATMLSQIQEIYQTLDTTGTSDSQAGANEADSDQSAAAGSGIAAATAGGVSLTGDAASIANLVQQHLIQQMGTSAP